MDESYASRLATVPPEGTLEAAMRKGAFHQQRLVYRVEYYYDPLEDDKKKGVRVTCTGCGETWIAPYVQGGACSRGGGAPFGFYLDKDGPVASGSSVLCPWCGAEARCTHIGDFRNTITDEVWVMTAGRHEKLKKDHPIFSENHVPQPKPGFRDSHPRIPLNEKTRCPFCGTLGAVKKLKYCGQRKNLWEEQRVIVLRWDGRNLWALGAWVHKDYQRADFQTEESVLCAVPEAAAGSTYRFSDKAVTYLLANYWGGTNYSYVHTDDYRLFRKTVEKPFGYCTEFGTDYHVIGMDALEKTPVKYCRFDNGDFIKTLHLAYVYPQKVEMLQKAGLGDCVKRYAEEGVKSSILLNWDAKTPAEFLKLKGAERREFLQIEEPSPDVLRLRSRIRKLGDEISIKEAGEIRWYLHSTSWNDLLKICKDRGLSPMHVYHYLKSQPSGMSSSFSAWKDYLEQSEKLGDTLHRSDLIFPKDLGKAHDNTARRYRERAEKLRNAEQKEKLRIKQERYEKRREELEKQFSWHAGGYFIRIPADGNEILQEGKKLAEKLKEAKEKLDAAAAGDAAEKDKLSAEVEQLKKQIAMSGAEVIAFKIKFSEWQEAYNAMKFALDCLAPEQREKCEAAIRAVLEGWCA